MRAVGIRRCIVCGILLFWFIGLAVRLKVVIWYRFDAIRVLFVELSFWICRLGGGRVEGFHCAVLCCVLLCCIVL